MSPKGAVALLLVALAGPAPAATNAVTVDGTVVPKATSTINASIDITEFRSGSESTCPRLLAGCQHYAVCVVSPAPVASLDGQFVPPNVLAPARFTVGVEDGREFGGCLLESLAADGASGKRRYVYCLRCESVTAPPAGS